MILQCFFCHRTPFLSQPRRSFIEPPPSFIRRLTYLSPINILQSQDHRSIDFGLLTSVLTNNNLFNDPLSRATRVSQYQKQEARLLQRDRATRYVGWNLVNYCTTVRKNQLEKAYNRWMTLKVIPGLVFCTSLHKPCIFTQSFLSLFETCPYHLNLFCWTLDLSRLF